MDLFCAEISGFSNNILKLRVKKIIKKEEIQKNVIFCISSFMFCLSKNRMLSAGKYSVSDYYSDTTVKGTSTVTSLCNLIVAL